MMAFFLCSALWTRKMNLALISEIIEAFWAYMKGNAGTHPFCHQRLCGYAGTSWLMNYFLEGMELSEGGENAHNQVNRNTWNRIDAWMLKPTNMSGLGFLSVRHSQIQAFIYCWIMHMPKGPLLKPFECLMTRVILSEEAIPVFFSSFDKSSMDF